jgi:hypothetical protein
MKKIPKTYAKFIIRNNKKCFLNPKHGHFLKQVYKPPQPQYVNASHS